MNEELIYFARTGSLVKIGYTTNLKSRLKDLRDNISWSGASLELLLSYPGDKTMERELHRYYDAYQVKLQSWREWFYLRGQLKEYLESKGCDCSDLSEQRMDLIVQKRSQGFIPVDEQLHEPSADRFWIPRQAPSVVLRDLMKKTGTTQRQLAPILGCDESNVSHFLRGKQGLTREQIDVLARYFNVTHAMFFGQT